MKQVTTRAWCRVDFAGGTLDIWPLGLLHAGAVTVNVALDLAAEVSLRPRTAGYVLDSGESLKSAESPRAWIDSPETALVGHLAQTLDVPPVNIKVSSQSPRGGGLGASSAIAMAFIAAAERLRGVVESDCEARSRLARDIEARMMGLPTGLQDHLPAALGGLLVIAHEAGGARIERLETDLDQLGASLVIAHSGQSHFSAGQNWRIIRRRLDGDAATVTRFEEITRIAQASAAALRAGDLATAGALMSEEWSHRRGLAEGISTPRIEAMLDAALAAGAWGGKACGAGGGGCVAVLAPAGLRGDVVAALEAEGRVLPTSPTRRALEIRVE